jgi:putative glycosyltransferase (TIGR04348 family)
MKKQSIVIVGPARADANNGNWQTASRWQRMLASMYRTRIVRDWPDDAAEDDAAMIALHARRSAASIDAWHNAHSGRGLAVVLTGTDLYRDIRSDRSAQRSLDEAQCLVVLQEQGPQALPARLRGKARVIFQSTTQRAALTKTRAHLRAVMVGHLREEKSPETLFEAARILSGEPDIFIDHIGAPLDPALGKAARATMAACPNYRWLGNLPHEIVRRRIQRAHVLVHTSRMEGGAHVIMEAVCSGTPVLASRIDGNVGMLGEGYSGYFEQGNAEALAAWLMRCRDDLHGARRKGTLEALSRQCRARQRLFSPETERTALLRLAKTLIENR